MSSRGPQREHIHSLDALFQSVDRETVAAPIGACAVFAGPAPSLGTVRSAVTDAVGRVPRWRKWVRFVPGEGPVWFDSAGFEAADHVRCVAMSAPGQRPLLRDLMSDLMAGELPSKRPLWDMLVVEGLEDDRWAILSKAHPCMVDGTHGADLLETLLGVRGLWTFGRMQSSFVAHPAARPLPAPGAAGRPWARAGCRLDDLDVVAAATACSVDEVVLTAVAGAYRDLVVHHGRSPDAIRFSALVPARVGMMITEVPVALPDPLSRLRATRERMRHLDVANTTTTGRTGDQDNDVVPAGLFGWAAQAAGEQANWVPERTVCTVLTNVSGARQPVSLLDRAMLEYVPFLPIGEGVRLGVAATTYHDTCSFGITGDVDSAADVEFFAARVEAAVADLLDVARPSGRAGSGGPR